MPKVKSYSAAWLSSNAPGHRLFEPSSEASKPRSLESTYSSKKKTIPGPRRTIAHRGTEVFVAVGREIRWGDLAYLKDEWANRYSKRGSSQGIRIKREDSTQPFDDEDLESAAGLRVCSCIMIYTSVANLSLYRQSRHPLPTTFDSWSYPRTRTFWPF
jgi:nucleoporin NUP82